MTVICNSCGCVNLIDDAIVNDNNAEYWGNCNNCNSLLCEETIRKLGKEGDDDNVDVLQ